LNLEVSSQNLSPLLSQCDHERLGIWFEEKFQEAISRAYDAQNGLDDVIHYILSGPGKRVRAKLCILTAKAFGATRESALIPAFALEFVHAYSLVHDDLPCMDNDDWRRGRPTAHKKFGEAQALLGGDAILADAFAIVSGKSRVALPTELPAHTLLGLSRELATAIGSNGMVLGQILDLYWTGKGQFDRKALDNIHLLKTGHLIGAAFSMGAVAADENLLVQEKLRQAGLAVGLAFQIKDDLLDDSPETGKSVGKDQATGKLTYSSVMSTAEALVMAEEHTAAAIENLHSLSFKNISAGEELVSFVRQLLNRKR
jgi:geranylgeranyl pyrophosphate synthase